MLEVLNIVKTYKSRRSAPVKALKGVSISFNETGLVFILGKSGCGKSTLLNAIGGLDKFDSGEIIIKGKSSKNFSQADFDSYRNTFIGFVFQEYNLLSEFSIEKNIAIALELQGKKADKESIKELLKKVDLDKEGNRKVTELSGGQKQRIAIARALIKDPEIIIADEPTGALDSNTGKQVLETLKNLAKTKLIIIVSHDREYAEMYADRIIEMKDGEVIADKTKRKIPPHQVSSGVTVIDNDVIHIKEGHQLNKEEVTKIFNILQKNPGEKLISFGKDKNIDIKKTINIDDDNNSEKFDQTNENDLQQKAYDEKTLKLIRSKLKLKDSFKIGASAVKTKPVRLLFTIILALVSFTLFGLTFAMTNFNNATIVQDVVTDNNVKHVNISKMTEYSGKDIIKLSEIQTLKEKFPDHKFMPVALKSSSILPTIINSSSTDMLLSNDICGLLATPTAEQMTSYNIDPVLLAGEWPTTSANEIVISKHLVDTMKINGCSLGTIEQYSDVLNKNISIKYPNSSTCPHVYYTIVGVVDTRVSLERFNGLEKTSKEYLTLAQQYTSNTLLNACFVSQEYFDEHFKNGDSTNSLCIKDSAQDSGSYSLEKLIKISSDIKSGITFKTGFSDVDNNQIVVPQYILQEIFKITGDANAVLNYINSDDVYLSIAKNYDKVVGKYKVVGFYSSHFSVNASTWVTILSNDDYDNLISNTTGFSGLFVNLLNNKESNLKLFKYFDKIFADKSFFSVDNQYSNVFNLIKDIVNTFNTVIIYIALGFAVFASIMLMNYISISVVDKKREIGILRAIGASGKDVFKIFYMESFIICCIISVLSCISTFGFAMLINNLIVGKIGVKISFVIVGIKEILAIWGMGILVSAISTFLPVVKIAKKQPINAINNK